jgi:hypothetical protein
MAPYDDENRIIRLLALAVGARLPRRSEFAWQTAATTATPGPCTASR